MGSRQQAVVKEFDPKAESPLAFLENPFMKHLCIQYEDPDYPYILHLISFFIGEVVCSYWRIRRITHVIPISSRLPRRMTIVSRCTP